MKASDIPEERVLAAIDAGEHFISGLEDALSDFPPRVVLARLRSMIRRGVLVGCACGCRGDFYRGKCLTCGAALEDFGHHPWRAGPGGRMTNECPGRP